jgi:hypothetical protein
MHSECRHFIASMETLGLVVSFLSRRAPFSEFAAGSLIDALQHQLSSNCHVCLVENEQLTGYLGWLPITVALGEQWKRDGSILTIVPDDVADAVALTIIASDTPEGARALIRAARMLNPARRVYFKRETGGGSARKASVLNLS